MSEKKLNCFQKEIYCFTYNLMKLSSHKYTLSDVFTVHEIGWYAGVEYFRVERAFLIWFCHEG